jgi:hypothetical protein
MREKVDALLRRAIIMTDLPISAGLPWHGSNYDYEIGFSGHRTDGIPENFLADVIIFGKKQGADFYFVQVMAQGQETVSDLDLAVRLSARRNGFVATYWARVIRDRDVTDNTAPLVEEIKNAIIEAWNDLPQLHQDMLRRKAGQER